MTPKLKRLRDQVIVITGASSGIGLTTAEMAAEQGARVVLNARNEGDLRAAVDRITSRGGRATYMVGDVAEPAAMDMVASHAIDVFGGFDTWVNNAGIGIFGRLTEVPLPDKYRVFDVNFWGVVHGCRAAVQHLRDRGGAIVNIGSVVSDYAIPLQGIYVASKHAVKGYTDVLRLELEEEGAPIAVSLVKPSAINTPYLEHARNYMEAEPEFPPPVYAPEEVARTILHCAEQPTREVVVGGAGKILTVMNTVAPRLTDRYMERVMVRQQMGDGPRTEGDSLDSPGWDGRRRGPTSRHTFERSAYTRAALSNVGRALPLVVAGAFVAAAIRGMRRAG
jgi:short-subunit dehydrogenase